MLYNIHKEILNTDFSFLSTVIWERSQVRQTADFRSTGEGLSKYPFVLIFPQNRHEQLLNEELSQHGIRIDRETELVELSQNDNYATATLKKKDGTTEKVDASYVIGCDGSSSRTRQCSSIENPGGTYEHRFYVADTIIDTSKSPHMSPADMNLCFSGYDFTMVFPLPHDQTVRLIGICPDGVDPSTITIDSLRPSIKRNSGVEVEKVNWLSTYKVQHRVASSFRDRHVFLCGDAAHVHSPVGGQGLNYSVQDATNLAWKLHTVCSGQSPNNNNGDDILDTYCTERESHARSLVSTTDRVFTLVTDKGWIGTFYRHVVMGYVVPVLAKFAFVGRYVFPHLSQTGIAYPDSKLSVNGPGSSGSVVAGSRLPWIGNLEKGGADNFEPLNGLWQMQIYGQEADEQLKEWGSEKGVEIVEIVPTQKEAQEKGLLPGTICLLRPDGYIGYISSVKDGYMEDLEKYADNWVISQKK